MGEPHFLALSFISLYSLPALVEKKTNELLLKESILIYLEADGSLTSQTFTNPLLGGTELLQGMDPARICPQPPTMEGAADAIDACECAGRGRRDYSRAISQSTTSSWRPSQSRLAPLPPDQSRPACPAPAGI